MADDDATFGEQILHVAEAEVEAEVQPHGVSDDLGWEAIAVIGRPVSGLRDGHQGEAYRRSALKLTTPSVVLLRHRQCKLARRFLQTP